MDEGSDNGPGPEHELVVAWCHGSFCLQAQTKERERERESFLGREELVLGSVGKRSQRCPRSVWGRAALGVINHRCPS